jgi:hypothetical protein
VAPTFQVSHNPPNANMASNFAAIAKRLLGILADLQVE